MKFSPQGNRLLIKIVPDKKTQIFIPDAQQKGFCRFIVEAVGPGKMLSNGTMVPPPFEAGQEVGYDVPRGYAQMRVYGLRSHKDLKEEDYQIVDADYVYCTFSREETDNLPAIAKITDDDFADAVKSLAIAH